MKKKLKVFLCHASENKRIVHRLYSRLQADGFDPWLDSEYLVPGMDWDLEIQKAIRASDAVIVCLSKVSVKKEGYVQKEIKYSREIQKEKPDGTIFLIPVQLEECSIPFSLQNVQWGKYFEPEGYQKIYKALRTRAMQLGRQVIDTDTNTPILLSQSEIYSEVNRLQDQINKLRPPEQLILQHLTNIGYELMRPSPDWNQIEALLQKVSKRLETIKSPQLKEVIALREQVLNHLEE